MKTINANDMHAKDMGDPAYRLGYDSLAGEFELLKALLHAREQTPPQIIEINKKSESA